MTAMRNAITRILPALLTIVLLIAAHGCAHVGDGPAANPMGILIPAYFYPTWWDAGTNRWDELVTAAKKVDLVAIMNPDSGPGTSQNSDYVTAVTQMRGAGGRVIGYVPTTYGDRDAADCRGDIDAYYAWYAVDGIFFDEMSTDTGKINYYRDLRDYVTGKDASAFITGNAGVNTDAGYIDTADLLVIFEQSTGYDAWEPSAWVRSFPDERFCNLVYGVSTKATMESYVELARTRNIGCVFITDDTLENPWNTLPEYWEDEVAFVAGRR